ncbi:MAG: siphovirus Gp157 family protein [Lactiplantibacillus plantarum]|nr:siphovirus Gp157 family protein [Leuconostoc sp.]MDN6524702.1 siphovirus Gp157 family protein [Lactococcus sp.]MDN6576499.1 siphovirus Gp157 family protein [Lactiplantibacillus plantarum]MDN6765532.1 siphovirus Gp157 family protein [Lactiplantibacillus plantarum]MDN6790922.1 siphovirus Gp157 family protein [Lactiplantibacillus plantarum]
MNLYELEGNLLHVVELANSAKPEDQQLFADTIESLQDSIADKAIGYGKVINQLVADEKQLADKIKHDQERKRALSNNISRLKLALQHGMETAGKEKVKDIDLSIWIQNNPVSVAVTDDKLIPGEFTEVEKKLNKTAIKQALNDGEEVPGAKLVQTRSIRIK